MSVWVIIRENHLGDIFFFLMFDYCFKGQQVTKIYRRSQVFGVFLLLVNVTSKNVESLDYCTLTKYSNWLYLSSIQLPAYLWGLNLWLHDIQPREFLLNRVYTATRVKRSKATTVYYSNST